MTTNSVITDPDGVNTTQTWAVVSDTTGVQAYAFTPNKVGTYTLSFTYPGQVHTWSGAYEGDYYMPASAVRTLEVTQEQVKGVTPGANLPTEYWSRPINGQNNNWYTIASNWLNAPQIRSGATATGGAGYARYQPDGSAPNTQHVMWTKGIQNGGVVGGTDTLNTGEGYYTGSSYNPRFSNAIIMNGVLFYQEPWGNSGSGGDYVAVDLQTGKSNGALTAQTSHRRVYPHSATSTALKTATSTVSCQTASSSFHAQSPD